MTADCSEHTLTLRNFCRQQRPRHQSLYFPGDRLRRSLHLGMVQCTFPLQTWCKPPLLPRDKQPSLALHISLFLHSQSGQLQVSLSTREACMCVMHWLSALIVHQPAKMCFRVVLLHFEGGKGTLMKQNLLLITLRQIKACVKCEWYVQHKWNMASSAFQWAASNKTAIIVISIFQGSITRFARNWIYFSDHLLTCITLKKSNSKPWNLTNFPRCSS
jgi:hypothetical protein